MTTEAKNTQTTGDEQVDVDTTEEETQEESTEEEETEESQEDSTEHSQIDYKAIADDERKRREDAEKTAADYAFKLRENKRKGDEDDESEDEDDAPLTRKELNEALQSFSQQNEKSQQDVQAQQLIEKYTTNEDEAEAAMLYWKNRVIPTGNLEEDVMFAVGGLNHKRVLATNDELKRSLKSKSTVNRDASDTHKEPTGSSEPKIDSASAQTIKSAGMKWDSKKRVYGKKLKDGKTFYFDPKTKKRWKE